MEIKRKTEVFVETRRRFEISRPDMEERVCCPLCNEMMLAAEDAAAALGIQQRRVFQTVESGAAHFIETEAGALVVCMTSLAAAIDGNVGNERTPLLIKAANTE